MQKRNLLMLLMMAALVFVASGCNMDIRDYCEAKMNCIGGNEADEDACVEQYDGEEDAADEYDCEDQFDYMMECLANKSECVESEYGDYSYFTDNGECEEKQGNYYECIRDASAIGGDQG